MNLSYARIRLPLAESLQRFTQWVGLPAVEPPRWLSLTAAVSSAAANGAWRSLVAVFAYESGEWTVFEDLTGYLASMTAEQWREFAGGEELVFAGYNESVPYGQLIVVRNGRVIREFLDDGQDPGGNVNRGRLDAETASPINDWIAAASFADQDAIVEPPEEGLLWLFGRRE